LADRAVYLIGLPAIRIIQEGDVSLDRCGRLGRERIPVVSPEDRLRADDENVLVVSDSACRPKDVCEVLTLHVIEVSASPSAASGPSALGTSAGSADDRHREGLRRTGCSVATRWNAHPARSVPRRR